MRSYKYPASELASHGCRLVSDESYADNEAERSVASSPIVDIPHGELLVGPRNNRLMLVHALLMSSDLDVLPQPQDGPALNDQDVIDLAQGLEQNFGYVSMIMPLFGKGAPLTAAQEASVNEVRDTRGPIWATVVGYLFTHPQNFRTQAERGRVHLARVIKQGVGIRDQVSMEPLLWESLVSKEFPNVMGWKFPSATLLRMIDSCMEQPEIASLVSFPSAPDGPGADVARPRQRA